MIDDDQYTVTIRFIVPDSEAVSYVLTHDIRAFALTEFEIDCTDETDNDNDVVVVVVCFIGTVNFKFG